jgi:hypothetical protein
MKKIALLFLIVLGWSNTGNSQERDSLQMPVHLNVISFNPTPMMVCNSLRNITLVYERMVKPSQSIVFQLGYLEFRGTLGDSLPKITTFSMNTSAGINAAFQYRFYLHHLNTHPAPFGLYLGPYASYYGLKFKSNYSNNNTNPVQSGSTTRNFNLYNIGFGLGYQFIFRERLTLDVLFFGPSLTYEVKNRVTEGNISENEQSKISRLLENAYSWDYPLFNKFIGEDGTESETYLTTFFRYSFTIGYHF